MEDIVYEDSPLAEHLIDNENQVAESDNDGTTERPAHIPKVQSFAPTGVPRPLHRKRRKTSLQIALETPFYTLQTIRKAQESCAQALQHRVAHSQTEWFLERFRYTIITSQLLSTQGHGGKRSSRYGNIEVPGVVGVSQSQSGDTTTTNYVLCGVAVCTIAVLMTYAHTYLSAQHMLIEIPGKLAAAVIGAGALFVLLQRQWMHYIRQQAILSASAFVNNATSFDSAVTSAITLIQEVELVSRGYGLTSPLPPISRLETSDQTRRCLKLREAVKTALRDLQQPLALAYAAFRPLAETQDLESYHDIYEIGPTEISQVENALKDAEKAELTKHDDLKDLKQDFSHIYLCRKLFLCTLLALKSDRTQANGFKWSEVGVMLTKLSEVFKSASDRMETILEEQHRFAATPTPQSPVNPNAARTRAQMRQLGALSQGIRALQAKMQILREDSARSLDRPDTVDFDLLLHYDAIGQDLKALTQEWETGRASLLNLRKAGFHSRQLSAQEPMMHHYAHMRSVTPTSEASTTITEERSPGAVLFSDHEQASSQGDESDGEEKIFEATSLPAKSPRDRALMSREARIAKMKADRDLLEKQRESGRERGNLVKELESVIRLRPTRLRRRTIGSPPALRQDQTVTRA